MLKPAIAAVNAVMAANPVMIVVIAIAALVAALVRRTGTQHLYVAVCAGNRV